MYFIVWAPSSTCRFLRVIRIDSVIKHKLNLKLPRELFSKSVNHVHNFTLYKIDCWAHRPGCIGNTKYSSLISNTADTIFEEKLFIPRNTGLHQFLFCFCRFYVDLFWSVNHFLSLFIDLFEILYPSSMKKFVDWVSFCLPWFFYDLWS